MKMKKARIQPSESNGNKQSFVYSLSALLYKDKGVLLLVYGENRKIIF